METFLSFLTVILIICMVGAALTFGFALLVWFVLFAGIITLFMVVRQFWYRWRFMHMQQQNKDDVHVIEVEYEEITNERDKR